MPEQTLYLFPDTNLFIQCKPLEELDWSEWQNFSEIHLLVSLPVQREIDDQKNRGNNRVAKRARATSQLFRKFIDDSQEYELIRSSTPVVKLYLDAPGLPSPDLKGVLNYSKADDEIVGYLHRFLQDNPDKDARLLTHDVGPMMAAKSLELPFVPIRDDWILPPEHNETERENARLKNEIEQLKNLGPRFEIRCLDEKDREIPKVEGECRVFKPLSDDDLEESIELLKRLVPMETNFGGKTPSFRPPSDRAIAHYTESEYPEWIEACRLVLSNLHKSLQRKSGLPRIRFAIRNSGTSPGRDTLIEIRARGQFTLVPPQEEYLDRFDEEEVMSLHLPPPPEPPRSRSPLDFVNLNLPSLHHPSLASSPQAAPASEHDPNAFYYKPEFPTAPANVITLSCDQWRHGNEGEDFFVEIWADANSTEVTGQIECVVQAENLSSPMRKGVSIKINVIKANTKDYAYDVIYGRLRQS